MHYSSKYCEDEPAEKKPKIEGGAVSRDDGANSHGATGTNSRDGDAREHPIPRATRVMQAAAMTNPPRVGHLILHQHQIDELLGEKITWNKFRKMCLKVENNLVYIRHYRYHIICDRLCVFVTDFERLCAFVCLFVYLFVCPCISFWFHNLIA